MIVNYEMNDNYFNLKCTTHISKFEKLYLFSFDNNVNS